MPGEHCHRDFSCVGVDLEGNRIRFPDTQIDSPVKSCYRALRDEELSVGEDSAI